MKKRALIIGLNYKGSPYELHGCEKDADAIAVRAQAMGVRCFVQKGVFSVPDLEDFIGSLRDISKASDITYLFYSGHGTQWYDSHAQGDTDKQTEGLCLWNGHEIEVLPDDDFRALVSSIPGNVVVILDSCFSGGMQRESARPGQSRRSIPFDKFPVIRTVREAPAAMRIYWLFACAESEYSWETSKGGNFTVSLCAGLDTFKRRSINNLMNRALTDCAPDQHPVFVKDGKANANKVIF